MLQTPPLLSPRLSTIAKLIPKCKRFADIGTDHAYLPVYLCMENICDTAIASDINRGPLLRAENTIKSYHMGKRISTRLGGGFETLAPGEAESLSIAGMGGLVIAKILEDGRDKIDSECTLVLQPMTAILELREYLYKNSWITVDEHLAKEEDKIYNIITVKLGKESEKLSDAELFLGRILIERKDECYDEYVSKKIKKLENMIKGLEKSETEQSKHKLAECCALLNDVEKLG